MKKMKLIIMAALAAILAVAAVILIMAVPADDLDTKHYVAILLGTKILGVVCAAVATRITRRIRYGYMSHPESASLTPHQHRGFSVNN